MLNKRWLKKKAINAVHDNDLESYLSSLGILDEIRQEQKFCLFCDIKIDLTNIGAVVPKEDSIHLVCDKSSCLIKLNIV